MAVLRATIAALLAVALSVHWSRSRLEERLADLKKRCTRNRSGALQYTTCADSIVSGTQTFTVDADSVVVATSAEWIVPPHRQRAEWDSAVARLNAAFGSPTSNYNAPVNMTSDAVNDSLVRVYCAAWRGPDSVEIALHLDPLSDVGSPRIDKPWRLRRYSRHGPLFDAVSCRLRSIPRGAASALTPLPSPSSQRNDCIGLSPTKARLAGRLAREVHLGPPGYGENPKTDAKDTILVLVLSEPVRGCSTERPQGADTASSHIQLLGRARDGFSHLGETVTVYGELSEAVWGWHFTPLVFDVDSIPAFRRVRSNAAD